MKQMCAECTYFGETKDFASTFTMANSIIMSGQINTIHYSDLLEGSGTQKVKSYVDWPSKWQVSLRLLCNSCMSVYVSVDTFLIFRNAILRIYRFAYSLVDMDFIIGAKGLLPREILHKRVKKQFLCITWTFFAHCLIWTRSLTSPLPHPTPAPTPLPASTHE